MNGNTYNTKQRALILELLINNKGVGLTCEEIADKLKENGTPVGKSTLYRYLEKLINSGDVRKDISLDGKSATFQFVDKAMSCHNHMHLKCTSCGKIAHLSCDFMESVSAHIFDHHQFTVNNTQTVILGLCNDCLGKGGIQCL